MLQDFPYSRQKLAKPTVDVVDLLQCPPPKTSFEERVVNLQLSKALEQKVHEASRFSRNASMKLTPLEEKELATEVLLLRHRFTEIVWKDRRFNQAALTVLQNIYLFKNRKIFFDPCGPEYEEERQEALRIFSDRKSLTSLPLAKTFQHLIIARVWNRIVNQADRMLYEQPCMKELLEVIERLNTVRNLYVILTTGLVKKIISQMGKLYRDEVSDEDACQIGSFGIARAAYRYHHSSGVRFSTYAAQWIKKEVQRQVLAGRLIRVSSNSVEQYSKAVQSGDTKEIERWSEVLKTAKCTIKDELAGIENGDFCSTQPPSQEACFELQDDKRRLHLAILSTLTAKEADIIRRRFGLSPYSEAPQSVISISELYGVTRSSIYQLETKIKEKLRKALVKEEVACY